MANTFNNTTTASIGTSGSVSTLYTAPNNDSGDRTVVVGLLLSNTHASSDVEITVKHGSVILLNAVTIPVNTSLEVCRGNKFVLKNNEAITAFKGSNGTASAMVSVLEIT